MRRILAGANYANVTASIALIVALGGTSYAAVALPKGSVGTPQIKKAAVTGAKIKRNAVTGAKIKDGSLLKDDFKSGQLPTGPQGPPGPQGPQGAAGATTVTTRSDTGTGSLTVSCEAGETVVGGGGFAGSDGGTQGFISRSRPNPGGGTATGWAVTGQTPAGVAVGVDVYVLCAKP